MGGAGHVRRSRASLPTRAELVGLALGLIGLVLLLNPAAIDWGASGALLGSLLLVVGAFGAAVALVHVRSHPWTGTPFDTQIWQLLVALVPMLLLMLLLERDELGSIAWDLPTALAVLYSGPLATAFAFWASQMIVRTLGPLTTGIGYLGAPAGGCHRRHHRARRDASGSSTWSASSSPALAIVVVLLAGRRRSMVGGPEGDELAVDIAPDGAELPELANRPPQAHAVDRHRPE